MKAKQLHYTSCRKGREGISGFQVRSASPGISQEDEQLIIVNGAYHRPRNLNAQPDREEILRTFPRAFRYYPLPSGQWALTLSCYTGKDYSGRFGNFFAHTLVFRPEILTERPVDLYEWSDWKTELAPEEDTEVIPLPLPEIELENIPPAESFTSDELRSFLAEDAGRKDALAAVVRSVFQQDDPKRPVIIQDTELNGLFWVACLSKAFPIHVAKSLSFSSFQFTTRNLPAVSATCGETEFVFGDDERRFSYYLFDFITGNHSDVPEEGEKYAAIVSKWMAESPQTLDSFHGFMNNFSGCGITSDLYWPALLFQFLYKERTNISEADIKKILEFSSRYAVEEKLPNLVDHMVRLGEMIKGRSSYDGYAQIEDMLAKCAKIAGEDRHRESSVKVWISAYEDLVLKQRINWKELKDLRVGLAKDLENFAPEMANLFLSRDFVKDEYLTQDTLSFDVLISIFGETLDHLRALGRKPPWEHEPADRIARLAISAAVNEPDHIGQLLEIGLQDPSLLARLVEMLGEAPESLQKKSFPATVGKCLHLTLAEQSSNFAWEVRQRVHSEMAMEILFHESRQFFMSARNKHAEYNNHIQKFRTISPDFMMKYEGRLAWTYLQILPEAERPKEAIYILQTGRIGYFSKETKKDIVCIANMGISFNLDDTESARHSGFVGDFIEKCNFDLHPNHSKLRNCVMDAIRYDLPFDDSSIETISCELQDANKEDCNVFFQNYLPRILNKKLTAKEHEKLVKPFLNEPILTPFKKNYLESFEIKKDGKYPISWKTALEMWLFSKEIPSSRSEINTFREEILSDLFDFVVKELKEASFDELCQTLDSAARKAGGPQKQWIDFRKYAEKKRGSIINKMTGLFRKKTK